MHWMNSGDVLNKRLGRAIRIRRCGRGLKVLTNALIGSK
jgi:hypothetical protein